MDTKHAITIFTQMEITYSDDKLSPSEREQLKSLLDRCMFKGGKIAKQWQTFVGPQTKKATPVQRSLGVGQVEIEVM